MLVGYFTRWFMHLSITFYYFYFAQSVDIRVFLKISKAFDKDWHPGNLYKLESHGVKGKFLDLLTNYPREPV